MMEKLEEKVCFNCLKWNEKEWLIVKMTAMTVWIRLVYGGEKVKDQDVDKAHGKSDGVHSKGGVLYVEKNGL